MSLRTFGVQVMMEKGMKSTYWQLEHWEMPMTSILHGSIHTIKTYFLGFWFLMSCRN